MFRRLPWLIALLLLLSMGLARAVEPDGSPSPGLLQPPTAESRAALDKALQEFERSAGTVVAEVGVRTVTWGEVADAIRAMADYAARVAATGAPAYVYANLASRDRAPAGFKRLNLSRFVNVDAGGTIASAAQ